MIREEKNERRREIYRYKKESALFRECTDKIISQINKSGYHVENLIRSSGYFIFDFGGNSCNTFNIKELPGWRFGLWWTSIERNGSKYVNGQLFTQFELDIDKFKPSRSEFVINREFILDKTGWKLFDVERYDAFEDFYKFSIREMLDFIKDHPYRAWARSSSSDGMKYRVPFSGFKCWRKYWGNRFYHWKDRKYEAWANRRLVSWVRKNAGWFYKGYEIIHRPGWSPSWQMYAPLAENKFYRKHGIYSMFFEDYECEVYLKEENLTDDVMKFARLSPKLRTKFKKLTRHYEKLGRVFGVCYYSGIEDDVVMLTKSAHRQFKEEHLIP